MGWKLNAYTIDGIWLINYLQASIDLEISRLKNKTYYDVSYIFIEDKNEIMVVNRL